MHMIERMKNCRIIAFTLITFALIASPLRADDWPAWRGDGSGVAPSAFAPEKWSELHNIRWKTPIPGSGHSSPIVSGNDIFLTTAIDGVSRAATTRYQWILIAAVTMAAIAGLITIYRIKQPTKTPHDYDQPTFANHPPLNLRRHRLAFGVAIVCATGVGTLTSYLAQPDIETLRFILCIDRQTGEIRWQTECATGPLLGSTTLTSAASPTPVTDGRYVYTHFGDVGTYCINFEGRVVWTNHDPVPETHYKAASSPILWNDLLIVTHDTDSHSFTVALDKHTGSRKWSAARKISNDGRRARVDAYSTPIIVRVGHMDQLVSRQLPTTDGVRSGKRPKIVEHRYKRRTNRHVTRCRR